MFKLELSNDEMFYLKLSVDARENALVEEIQKKTPFEKTFREQLKHFQNLNEKLNNTEKL